MTVVGNTCSEIGDILIIESKFPILGISSYIYNGEAIGEENL